MADHNEALRLVEWLRQNSSGTYRPAADAADLLVQQAERIDQLRAEVSELRAALWHVKHVAKDVESAKAIAADAIDHARTTHKDEG